MKNILKILGSILLILVGLAGMETAFMEDSIELGGKIFAIVCMVPFIIVGIVYLKQSYKELKKEITPDSGILVDAKGILLPMYASEKDSNDNERFLTKYRKTYADYMASDIEENHPIQNMVNQIYFNVLQLQKLRLARMGINVEFTSQRKLYGKESVTMRKIFDKKYDVTDVNEDIAARTVFSKDSKEIYTKIDSQTAHYTILETHQTGPLNLICPNCGSDTTREKILDGCDFCGSKFLIEDLSKSISDFSLRTNFEVLAQKYQRGLKRIGVIAIAIVFVICIILSLFFTYEAMMDIASQEAVGIFMTITASIFTASIGASVFAFIGVPVVTAIVVPILGSGYMALEVSKKTYLRMQEAQKKDVETEKAVRAKDPHFSLANFYSGVQNKIATIMFADNMEQASSFTSSDLDISAIYERYKDVIYMNVVDIDLKKYLVSGGLQNAEVEAEVKVVTFDGNKAATRNETLNLTLTKSASCKTQAICAPKVLTCQGCGLSISLLEGKRCKQCGRELDFESMDYIIRSISVK